jgi:hypothetical protein
MRRPALSGASSRFRRVDVPWTERPEAIWVFLFEVFSDLLVVGTYVSGLALFAIPFDDLLGAVCVLVTDAVASNRTLTPVLDLAQDCFQGVYYRFHALCQCPEFELRSFS